MPAATLTIAELIEGIAGLSAEQVEEAVNLMYNHQAPAFKNLRSKAFAGGKAEGKGPAAEYKRQLAESQTRVGELEEELETLKASAPTVQQKDQEWKTKYDKKVGELKVEIERLNGLLKKKGLDSGLTQFTEYLTGDPEDFARNPKLKSLQLGEVNPEYAKLVLKEKYKDRLVLNDAGEITDVLKPGETTGYEAETIEEKLAMLAAHVRKEVTSTFMVGRGGRGGDVRPGGGGSTGSGPDKDAIRKKKSASGAYGI